MMYSHNKQIKVVDRVEHFLKPFTEGEVTAIMGEDTQSMLLESVDIVDIEQAYAGGFELLPDMMLEAIKAKAARLETRIIGFSNTLNKYLKPAGIEVTGREIGKPRKSGSVAVQVAKINLSDGQSISLVFHAPDNDPLKINADDTLIAFRFLVNSRDVTHAVSPSGGRDISRSQMALALSNLVEKNSEKFAARQKKNEEQKQALEEAQAQMESIEADISEKSDQLDSIESENEKKKKRINTLTKQINNQNEIQEELRKQLALKSASSSSATSGDGQAKTTDSKLLESPTFKAATEVVVKDGNKNMLTALMNISGIDSNDPNLAGFDRSLFVSNLANRLKTLKRQGNQEQVNNILTMIAEYNKVANKPAFTKRHSIWKLGEVNDVPVVPEDEQNETEYPEDQINTYGYLAQPTTPSNGHSFNKMKGKDLDSGHYVIEYDEHNFVTISRTEEGISVEYVLGGGLNVQTRVYDNISDVKHFGPRDFSTFSQAVIDNLTENNFSKERLEQAASGALIPNRQVDASGETQVQEEQDELHWYGLQARPYGMGTTPSDAQAVKVLNAEEAQAQFPSAGVAIRHGAIGYAQELTPEQVKSFELKPLKQGQTEEGSLADSDAAELIVRNFFYDWMERKDLERITQAQLNDILMVAKDGFQKAFPEVLRQQAEFKERKNDVEAYKVWQASLSLVTPQMLEEEARAMGIVVSDVRVKNEKAINALSELVQGKKMASGWNIDRSGLDTAGLNLDNTMYLSVNVESPLYRIDALNPHGDYDIHYHEDGHFYLTYSEGSPVEGAENLSDWSQVKDALQSAYVADLQLKELADQVIGTDWLEDFNEMRKEQGLPEISGLDDTGEETKQHEDNSSNFVGSVRALITSVQNGVLALKDAKLMVKETLIHSIPEGARGDLLERSNAPKNKKRWIEALNSWVESKEHYDPNAPVVQTSNGTVNFNEDTYDVIDELGMFGKPLVAVAKTKPENLVQLFSDRSMYNEEDSERLVQAVQAAYMKPEPQPEPEPEQEPESEPQPTLELKKKNDLVYMGSGRYIIYSILPNSNQAVLLDFDDREEVFVHKDDLERAGIYIEGLSQLPFDDSIEDTLKPILKGLDTTGWFEENGSMNYQGQDDIYDTLLANGYDSEGARQTAQRIRLEHNGGERPFIETYTDQQPEPESEPVENNTEEQALVEKLRSIRDYTGEATLDLIEQYQADFETAYEKFESAGTLDEHNDLLEAAFARFVELQSEVTV